MHDFTIAMNTTSDRFSTTLTFEIRYLYFQADSHLTSSYSSGAYLRRRETKRVDSSASRNFISPRLENLCGSHEEAVSRDTVEVDDTVVMSSLTTELPGGVAQATDPLKTIQSVASSSQRSEPLPHGSK